MFEVNKKYRAKNDKAYVILCKYVGKELIFVEKLSGELIGDRAIGEEYTISKSSFFNFKEYREPRWKKGDIFEFENNDGFVRRSHALFDDETESESTPTLAGHGLAYRANTLKPLNINIYDL